MHRTVGVAEHSHSPTVAHERYTHTLWLPGSLCLEDAHPFAAVQGTPWQESCTCTDNSVAPSLTVRDVEPVQIAEDA